MQDGDRGAAPSWSTCRAGRSRCCLPWPGCCSSPAPSAAASTLLRRDRPHRRAEGDVGRARAELGRATAPYDAVVAQHFPHEFVAGFTDMADRGARRRGGRHRRAARPVRGAGGRPARTFRAAGRRADRGRRHQPGRRPPPRDALRHVAGHPRRRLRLHLAGVALDHRLALLTRQAKAMATERLPQGVSQVLQTPLGEDVVVPEVEPVRVNTRTRWPRSPERSPRCRTPRSTWRSSRRCCGATSPTAS